ncbi:MAG: DUF1439 domain-containing protein [Methylococcales bacterium]|nr:DUF1439 domain-containing protein [Methylococcales bacterium]
MTLLQKLRFVSVGFLFWVLTTNAHAFSYTVTVAEQELQEYLSLIKPLEKRSRLYRITLSDPRVNLVKGDERIHFSVQMALSLLGAVHSQGSVEVSGEVEYNPETSQFFLIRPQVEAIEMAGIPERTSQKIKSVLQQVISTAFSKVKVYQLQDSDVKQRMLKAVLESVVVGQDEQLRLTLKVF